jgi:type IV fimbrial biogenesis protein FimT
MLVMYRLSKLRSGFTLIELMVVIAIIAIMATVASPSFTEIQRNSELVSATNNLVATLNNARSEAMKNGVNAGIIPTTTGTASTDWNLGITSFVDKDFDGAFDATKDTLLRKIEILPSYLTITSSNTTNTVLLFNAPGYLAKIPDQSFGNTTFTIQRTDVAAAQQISQTRRIMVAVTGRVRSCKPSGAASDDCKVNSLN